MEKIWHKLKSGLQDYCAKNGFKKVILGLSGGLDSAMVAVLAADVLGGENVKAVMMKTKYTSSLSRQIAQEIATLNHLDYQEIDIDNLVAVQGDFLKAVFHEEPKGVVLENLQARQRGVILMALSNQTNALVLACGNKSEAAMGYCTLYGDTCGGLMPLVIFISQIYTVWPSGATSNSAFCRLRFWCGRRRPNSASTKKMRIVCRLIRCWIKF